MTGQYVCSRACSGCRYNADCKAKASKKRYEKLYKQERHARAAKETPKFQSK